MKIRTVESQFKFGDLGMNWIHVNGTMSENKNINTDEANRCIELASEMVFKYPDATIGIVTPFKDRYKKILELLPQELNDIVKIDTVHKYQGDEKDIMIFSTVVTEDSAPGKANFINRNEYLINVAVTRARSSLYIVGNQTYCKSLENGSSSTPLSQLSLYAERERKRLNSSVLNPPLG